MLILKDIESGYGLSKVLEGVSLTINEGEVVTLMGRNGMGKTTTIKTIMGMVTPQKGAMSFKGKDIFALPSYKIAALGLGLVPEGRHVFPTLSVEENLIATAANRSKTSSPWDLAKVYALFPRLGERKTQKARTLSGGEQQMLAVSRALMTNPHLLILDEATEGLAPLIREEIWNCLKTLKKNGQSILVVDKNISALAEIAERHYVLEKGKNVWQGTTQELLSQRDIIESYVGVS